MANALNKVNSGGIEDGSIVNADIKSDAAIAASKLSGVMPLAGGTFTGDVTFDNQTNAGRDIVWDESDDALEFKDNTAAVFGSGNDLYIHHNGSDNVIEGAQHLIVKTTDAAKKIYLQSDAGIDISDVGVNEYQARFINDGAVELYHDGTKRFETNSVGCALRGTVQYVEGLLRPWAATGTDLGTSSDRFQNLYLHGGMYLGGTGSANYMQDYEEGTWTPDLGGFTALSFNSRAGRYTKIGRFVYASAYMNIASRTGSGSHMKLTGLPFTSADTNATGTGTVGYSGGLTGDTYNVPTILMGTNETQAAFYKGDGTTFASVDLDMSSGSIYINIIYET